MNTWRNGERGDVIKKIIDDNFSTLEKNMSNNVLALSTEERNLLSSTRLKGGFTVFDTTLHKWLQYNNGEWTDFFIPNSFYVKQIAALDWNEETQGGVIYIPFSEHHMPNPIVYTYLKDNDKYKLAICDVDIDVNYNIILSSDLAFNGKVVIK